MHGVIKLAGVLRYFCLSLLWGALVSGLVLNGAVESYATQLVFLLLALSLMVALWVGLADFETAREILIVLAVGVALLLSVLYRNTLLGGDFVVLLLGWMTFVLTFLFTRQTPRQGRAFLMALILLGGLEALYGFVQSVGGFDYIARSTRGLGRVASGTLVNPNHFAALLNITLPLAVALLLHRGRGHSSPKQRSEWYARAWVIAVACSLMGLVVLQSRSRASTLTLLLCLLFMLAMSRVRMSGRTPATTTVVLLVVILLIAGLAFWVGVDALSSKFAAARTDWSVREWIYKDTLRLIADHPLTGVGPGMFQWRFRPYQSQMTYALAEHAHSDYLESAAEWGIPLAVLFWAWVVWRLYVSVRTYFESRARLRGAVALGCATAILAVLLESSVDFSLQIPANWMIFAMVLGVSSAVARRRTSSDEEREKSVAPSR